MGNPIVQKILPLKCRDALHRAGERTAQRMPVPVALIEQFLHMRRRFVAIHEDLLRDDSAFALDVARGEFRIKIKIAEHVAKAREKFGGGGGVVACSFLGGESVHVAAHAFDFLHDAAGGASGRAFEEHVLDEMRDAVEPHRFMASADTGPDAQGGGFGVGDLTGGDAQAAGKSR